MVNLFLIALAVYFAVDSTPPLTGNIEDAGNWFDKVWKQVILPTSIKCKDSNPDPIASEQNEE